MAWPELRGRGGRTLALGSAILVASTGFTVLTASSDAARLQTVGTVQESARATFDILVRPKNARLPVERSEKLIQPGFLTSVFGGISMSQWQSIKKMSGVEVAAPIAVVGFLTPRADVFVDTTRFASRTKGTTIRFDGEWRLPDGTKRSQQPRYVYTAPEAVNGGRYRGDQSKCGPPVTGPMPKGTTVTSAPAGADCFFEKTTASDVVPWETDSAGLVGARIPFPFPFLLTAVDPDQETRLLGLDSAATAGSVAELAKSSNSDQGSQVPVLLAQSSPVKGQLDLTFTRLPEGAASVVTEGRSLEALQNLKGTPVGQTHISTDDAYGLMRNQMSTFVDNPGYPGNVFQYWTVSPPTFAESTGGELSPGPVRNDLSKLWVDGSDFSVAPAGNDDVQFRKITLHREYAARRDAGGKPPALVSKGLFDPNKLRGLADVTSQVLAGFATAPTRGADAASKHALGDKPVPASTNLGALVQPPPMMLADINSLPKLVGGNWQPNAGARPLSAIRIRVKGVTGVDEVSRERVRLVAQRIQSETGLDVDITVGSSTTEKTIIEPAGKFGRPEITLRQTWVKLGVGVVILKALDKKSLILFALVLLVSALSVANSAVASVRSRRTDLGVLACVGWPSSALFRVTLTELGIVALAAGGIAAALSLILGQALDTPVSLLRALLAVPAALAVTLVAGLVPAMLAARANPMDAVHPPISPPRRPKIIRTVTALARSNLARLPARTFLAALGLGVATTVFTLLLAITIGFQGAVVGSVLGDAVAIQARGADYAAAIATLALAALGVANLMYLNIRDRGAELATLRAVGWDDSQLNRLLLVEGTLIGLLGGVLGGAAGYLGAWLLIRDLPGTVVLGALVATTTSILLAMAATSLAVVLLGRLPTTQLLTE